MMLRAVDGLAMDVPSALTGYPNGTGYGVPCSNNSGGRSKYSSCAHGCEASGCIALDETDFEEEDQSCGTCGCTEDGKEMLLMRRKEEAKSIFFILEHSNQTVGALHSLSPEGKERPSARPPLESQSVHELQSIDSFIIRGYLKDCISQEDDEWSAPMKQQQFAPSCSRRAKSSSSRFVAT